MQNINNIHELIQSIFLRGDFSEENMQITNQNKKETMIILHMILVFMLYLLSGKNKEDIIEYLAKSFINLYSKLDIDISDIPISMHKLYDKVASSYNDRFSKSGNTKAQYNNENIKKNANKGDINEIILEELSKEFGF